MGERLIIRSYRRVFQVDRRIYRVDRWALPVPGGVPLRGVGYFAATLVVLVVCGSLPGVGALVGALSPPLRYVVLPLAVAVAGTQAAPDGRSAHRFAWDWLRFCLRARRRCAGRMVPLEGEPVTWDRGLGVCWDGHGAALHRARVHGPARVTFGVPVELAVRRGRLVARRGSHEAAPQAVVLGGREILEVRP
jgi:TcpE family